MKTTLKMVSLATSTHTAPSSAPVLQMTSVARATAQRVIDLAAQAHIAHLIAEALNPNYKVSQ